MSVLIEAQYLPCVDFFSKVYHHDTILIEACESYQKQSYRNRTRILNAQQVEDLHIPVLSGNSHMPIKEVRIDHGQKWRLKHQRAIRSAYGKAPFFEYYADELLKLYDEPKTFLLDFNLELLTLCLDLLKWKKKITLTTDYQSNTNLLSNETIDFRDKIHPKEAPNHPFKAYQQVFGKTFEHNLSIIDLLFCEGNQANLYIVE